MCVCVSVHASVASSECQSFKLAKKTLEPLTQPLQVHELSEYIDPPLSSHLGPPRYLLRKNCLPRFLRRVFTPEDIGWRTEAAILSTDKLPRDLIVTPSYQSGLFPYLYFYQVQKDEGEVRPAL